MPRAAPARYVECEATRRSGLEGRTFMRVQGIDVVYNGSSRWAVRGGFVTDRPGLCRELAKLAKHYGLLTGTAGNIRTGAWNASCATSAPWAPMSTGRDDTTRGSRGRLGRGSAGTTRREARYRGIDALAVAGDWADGAVVHSEASANTPPRQYWAAVALSHVAKNVHSNASVRVK